MIPTNAFVVWANTPSTGRWPRVCERALCEATRVSVGPRGQCRAIGSAAQLPAGEWGPACGLSELRDSSNPLVQPLTVSLRKANQSSCGKRAVLGGGEEGRTGVPDLVLTVMTAHVNKSPNLHGTRFHFLTGRVRAQDAFSNDSSCLPFSSTQSFSGAQGAWPWAPWPPPLTPPQLL